jgi:hypothetical protein
MTGFPTSQLSGKAATPNWNAGVGGESAGFQQLTSDDLATAQFLAVPDGATLAVISIEGGDCRWRDDTIAPTALIGVVFTANQQVPVMTYSAALNNIMFIASSGAPVLNVAFYR